MELPKTKPPNRTAAARAALALKRQEAKLTAATDLLRDSGALVLRQTPRCPCGHAIGHHGTESGICFVGECTCNKGRAQRLLASSIAPSEGTNPS